jgi:hypothetical protein
MLNNSIFLLVSFALGAGLFWFATRDSWKKENSSNVLNNGHMVDLRQGDYLFKLNSEYRLAVSVENEQFSLRLHDKKNNYSNHIRFADSKSFISVTQKNDDLTTVIVDEDCDGIPDFRVIRRENASDTPVKENLRILVEP